MMTEKAKTADEQDRGPHKVEDLVNVKYNLGMVEGYLTQALRSMGSVNELTDAAGKPPVFSAAEVRYVARLNKRCKRAGQAIYDVEADIPDLA